VKVFKWVALGLGVTLVSCCSIGAVFLAMQTPEEKAQYAAAAEAEKREEERKQAAADKPVIEFERQLDALVADAAKFKQTAMKRCPDDDIAGRTLAGFDLSVRGGSLEALASRKNPKAPRQDPNYDSTRYAREFGPPPPWQFLDGSTSGLIDGVDRVSQPGACEGRPGASLFDCLRGLELTHAKGRSDRLLNQGRGAGRSSTPRATRSR
jgi:hypothetical protein